MSYTHSYIKKFYRFCLMRQYLLTLNSSGLYNIKQVRLCSIVSKIPYNTLRADLSWFVSNGVLRKDKNNLKLIRLSRTHQSLYGLYIRYAGQISDSKTPAIFFADLYKRKQIHSNVIYQVKKEAAKSDPINGKKLLKLVNHSKAELGEKQGVYLSLGTIGRLLGRSKTTAYKYMERLNMNAIVGRIKNRAFICHSKEYYYHRKTDKLYGRLFVRNGEVYERLLNSYVFIW